jgi:hypothetical protein
MMIKRKYGYDGASNSRAGRISSVARTAAAAGVAFALFALAAPDCRAQSGASAGSAQAESSGGTSKWIGMTTHQVRKKLGEPTSSQMLQETGGLMLIYAKPGKTHYVFEIGPNGKVDKAAVIH